MQNCNAFVFNKLAPPSCAQTLLENVAGRVKSRMFSSLSSIDYIKELFSKIVHNERSTVVGQT